MRVCRWGGRKVGHILGIAPEGALFGGVVWGVLLIMLSFVVGAEDFEVADRQVGYLAALNWSAGFTLVFPVIAFFGLHAIQSFPDALRRLQSEQMLVNDDWKPVGTVNIIPDYVKVRGHCQRTGAIFFLLAVLGSLLEWAYGSGYPLWIGNAAQTTELDWSVVAAARHPGELVPAIGNAALGIGAFLYQGFAAGFILTFLYTITRYAKLVRKYAVRRDKLWLIPNPDSTDKRRGFEVWDEFLENVLGSCAGMFFFFYLSSLQNAYLRDQSSASVFAFVRSEIEAGFQFKDGQSIPLQLLDAIGAFNYSTNIVAIAGVVAATSMLLTTAILLRGSARFSKERLLEFLTRAKDPLEFTQLTVDQARSQVKEMEIWPFGQTYFARNSLLLGTSVCLLAIIFYRVGLFLFGLAIAAVLVRAAKRLLA